MSKEVRHYECETCRRVYPSPGDADHCAGQDAIRAAQEAADRAWRALEDEYSWRVSVADVERVRAFLDLLLKDRP